MRNKVNKNISERQPRIIRGVSKFGKLHDRKQPMWGIKNNEDKIKMRIAAKTMYHCPHCHKTFNHRQMWRGIAIYYGNVWGIVAALKLSWKAVRQFISRYRLDEFCRGTVRGDSWDTVALNAGFYDATEMFWKLKMSKHMPYEQLAKAIGLPDNVAEVKRACQTFLLPYRMKLREKPKYPQIPRYKNTVVPRGKRKRALNAKERIEFGFDPTTGLNGIEEGLDDILARETQEL